MAGSPAGMTCAHHVACPTATRLVTVLHTLRAGHVTLLAVAILYASCSSRWASHIAGTSPALLIAICACSVALHITATFETALSALVGITHQTLTSTSDALLAAGVRRGASHTATGRCALLDTISVSSIAVDVDIAIGDMLMASSHEI